MPPPALVRAFGFMDDTAEEIANKLNALRDEADDYVIERSIERLETLCDRAESNRDAYLQLMTGEWPEGYESE